MSAFAVFCRKMQAKGVALKDLRDVAQLRVVLHPKLGSSGAAGGRWSGANDKQLCYHVMGLVCSTPGQAGHDMSRACIRSLSDNILLVHLDTMHYL